jgi:hypothetical protein
MAGPSFARLDFATRLVIVGVEEGPPLAEQVPDDVVAEVARELVVRTAPEELPLFRATSDAYFENPDKALERRGGKDEMLGFGVEAAAILITPIALDVAKRVALLLASQFRDAVKKESGEAIGDFVHDLFHRSEAEAERAAPPPLTPEQLEEVRDVAFERARQLDLPEDRANILADAVIGGLAAPGPGTETRGPSLCVSTPSRFRRTRPFASSS